MHLLFFVPACQTPAFFVRTLPCLDDLYPTSKQSKPLRLSYLISICLQPLGEISTSQTIIRASLQSGALDVVPVNAPAGHIAQVCTDVVLGVIVPGARWIRIDQFGLVWISIDQFGLVWIRLDQYVWISPLPRYGALCCNLE